MKKLDPVLSGKVGKQPARSWLFTPATKPERFGKAREVGADVQIIDLEDSVAPSEKESSRKNAFGYLGEQNARGPLLALRVNAMRTLWGLRDLLALVQHEAQSDFVIIPKVESTAKITLVADLLEECRKSSSVVAMVESARAITRLEPNSTRKRRDPLWIH